MLPQKAVKLVLSLQRGKCSSVLARAPGCPCPIISNPESWVPQHPLGPHTLRGCVGDALLWNRPLLGLDRTVVKGGRSAYGGKRNFAVTASGRFRVPFTGCLPLGKVVLQLSPLYLALWRGPSFITVLLRWKPNCPQDHVLSQTNPWGCM